MPARMPTAPCPRRRLQRVARALVASPSAAALAAAKAGAAELKDFREEDLGLESPLIAGPGWTPLSDGQRDSFSRDGYL